MTRIIIMRKRSGTKIRILMEFFLPVGAFSQQFVAKPDLKI